MGKDRHFFGARPRYSAIAATTRKLPNSVLSSHSGANREDSSVASFASSPAPAAPLPFSWLLYPGLLHE